jgi:hypothetical protein
MVSTLRITSVVVILLAGLVLVLVVGPRSLVPDLLAGFAVRNDPEIERILTEPSVVDAWRDAHGDSPQSNQGATAPLVREAESFKNILDPPPAPVTAAAKRPAPAPRPSAVVKPVPSSANFELIGTTVSADNSFAYIRLPDRTYRWVRKGEEIGHLRINEIRHGAIVCWDGHADVEMVTEPIPATASLLEAEGSSASRADVRPSPVASASAGGRITGEPVARPWTPESSVAQDDEMNDQEDLISRLRELQKSGPWPSDPNAASEDRDAVIKKLMAEYRSSRISPEEAKKVEDLGRELNESVDSSSAERPSDARRKLSIPRVIRQ